VSGSLDDFQLSSTTATDYQLTHDSVLGDGTSRIAGIRLRIKHTESSDTLVVKDSCQITCLAIDNTSGNVNRTYNNGNIS
jgi:hypothetical protein